MAARVRSRYEKTRRVREPWRQSLTHRRGCRSLQGMKAVIPRLSREKVLQRFRVHGAEVKRLDFVMLVQPDDVVACVRGINSHDAIDVDVAPAELNELHDVVDWLYVCVTLPHGRFRPLADATGGGSGGSLATLGP